jgi:hypothetical protein
MDVEQVIVVTQWGAKWLKYAWDVMLVGNRKERVALSILKKLDECVDDPECFVDVHQYSSLHTVVNKVDGVTYHGPVVRTKAVLKRGRRSSFSASVAQLAYNKFGERPMSEANVLVTRRWLQKLLDDKKYKDLRTCDKNLAIDRALFLSFVPTNSFRAMKLAVATSAWKDRCDNESVFGRVFRLVGLSSATSAGLDLIA